MDHRGTSDFPGYVVTLVKEDELKVHLEEKNCDFHEMNKGNNFLSECIGNVYLVPKDETKELIGKFAMHTPVKYPFRHEVSMPFNIVEELDYREKGGYHRHLISVRLLKETPYHAEQEWATALVYTGSIDNPNFSIQDKISVASILAFAIGQSGENAEYFLNLTDYIRSHNLTEIYLWELEREMLLCMCSWRARRYMKRFRLSSSSWKTPHRERVRLVGWGSNEYQQLEPFPVGHVADVKSDEIISFAKELDNIASTDVCQHCIFPGEVTTGGSSSGLLTPEGHLFIWGGDFTNNECFLESLTALNAQCKVNFQLETETAVKLTSPFSAATHAKTLLGVDKVVMGHDMWLLIMNNGRVVSMGNNKHGGFIPILSERNEKCTDDNDFVAHYLHFSLTNGVQSYPIVNRNKDFDLTVDPISLDDSNEIIYLATGVRHSVAISTTGAVYAWGDKRYFPADSHLWSPPSPSSPSVDFTDTCTSRHNLEEETGGKHRPIYYHLNVPIKVLNACCGAKHTILVDNIGRVWSFGDNAFGQLGRELCIKGNTETASGKQKKQRAKKVDVRPGQVNVDAATDKTDSSSRTIRWLKVVTSFNLL